MLESLSDVVVRTKHVVNRPGRGYANLHVNWVLFVCCLVASRPSDRLVYLRDGSTQTIVRAATLR